MNFILDINDIRYIQKKFGYDGLLGIENGTLPLISAEKKLLDTGIAYKDARGHLELKPEYRYLFGAWKRMRYSIVRPETCGEVIPEIILANEKEIILILREGNKLSVALLDFEPSVMDNIILNFAPFDIGINSSDRINISLSVDDMSDIIEAIGTNKIKRYSNMLGISKEQIERYINNINQDENSFLLLCEDHKGDAGSFFKVVNADDGIYALKHVTPADISQERMTMIIGSAGDIIDSVYNF